MQQRLMSKTFWRLMLPWSYCTLPGTPLSYSALLKATIILITKSQIKIYKLNFARVQRESDGSCLDDRLKFLFTAGRDACLCRLDYGCCLIIFIFGKMVHSNYYDVPCGIQVLGHFGLQEIQMKLTIYPLQHPNQH